MKKIILSFVSLSIVFLLTGCFNNNSTVKKHFEMYVLSGEQSYKGIDNSIKQIANQLFFNNIIENKNKKIIITTISDLNDFKKTTPLGRTIGESLINELHIRGFSLIDFRGRDEILVNPNGEFFITREVEKLRDDVSASYVLVGNYSKLSKNYVVLNIRIIDILTGEIVSTARVNYKFEDCKMFDLCEPTPPKLQDKVIDIKADK